MKKNRFLYCKQARTTMCLMLLLLPLCSNTLMAQHVSNKDAITSSLNLYTDLLYVSDKNFYQDYYIISPQQISATIEVKCYWFKSDKDSVLVYKNISPRQALKQGLNNIKVKFQVADGSNYILPTFATALRRTGIYPSGIYRTLLILHHDDEDDPFVFMHVMDSTLSLESHIRTGLNSLLLPAKHNFLGQPIKIPSSSDKASAVFDRSKHKLAKYCKKNGLTFDQYTKGGKAIIDFYSDEWFMGRYAMDDKASVSDIIGNEQKALEHNVGDLTKNELGNFKSLMTQFRELKEEAKEKDEIQGQIALSSNFSTSREPNSAQDNNYYEATGAIALPLFNIPFNISGYYTSQDKHREAKAGYVHLSYDVEKAKEQLLKLISSYNKRYAQTLSQGGSYEMIYGQYLDQLQQQKAKAITALKNEIGIADINTSNFNESFIKEHFEEVSLAAKEKVLDTLTNIGIQQKKLLEDSLADMASNNAVVNNTEAAITKAQVAKQKATDAYTRAMDKYNELLELERKIEKYRTLLGQYKNTIFYDSLMAYSKLSDLKDISNMSYKDMAKRASALLPEGKMKHVVTGLTNFDAGMFPKYASDYTLSGQMLKGLDMGYDVGMAEIGGTYGKTQYIDHNGGVEDYKMYSLRARFKPLLHQQFGLVYMGYSPSANLMGSANFLKDVDVSVPSFRKPVQIISATYTGDVGKHVSLMGEYAVSYQSGQPSEAAASISFIDRSSYNIKAIGNIPSTLIQLEAGYEHTGNAFTNNTLPVIMAGTDKFSVNAKGDFFHSFLTLGTEYNYLIQSNFYSKGKNTRWGFDIATHSKRYPAISLSYKPFSTFRSVNDTMAIAQKPILGEVWTGKLSYQIKKMNKAIRFMLLYNRNRSIMDSMNYQSSLLQWSTILSKKATMLSFSIGKSDISTDFFTTAYPIFNKSGFMNISAAGNVLKNVAVSGGTDIASSKIGLCKYGLFAGITYTFGKLPLLLRGNFRYSNYRLDEGQGWNPIYAGGIELAWKFNMKMWD